MKYVIDRIENKKAILEKEDGSFLEVPLEILPKGVQESDVIRIEKDDQETEALKERTLKLMEEVWE